MSDAIGAGRPWASWRAAERRRLIAIAALWRHGMEAAPTLLVVLLANFTWLSLALEWASRRAGSEAFLAPVSA